MDIASVVALLVTPSLVVLAAGTLLSIVRPDDAEEAASPGPG